MLKSKGFEIVLSSDNQYEQLCAELYYDGNIVAIISQEQGLDKAIVEIFSSKTNQWTFSLSEFISATKQARDELI